MPNFYYIFFFSFFYYYQSIFLTNLEGISYLEVLFPSHTGYKTTEPLVETITIMQLYCHSVNDSSLIKIIKCKQLLSRLWNYVISSVKFKINTYFDINAINRFLCFVPTRLLNLLVRLSNATKRDSPGTIWWLRLAALVHIVVLLLSQSIFYCILVKKIIL